MKILENINNVNIQKEVFENTIILLRDQNFSKKEIVEFHRKIGYTPIKKLPWKKNSGLWFEDNEYYDLMYNTNYSKEETDNRAGLFGTSQVDWHYDGPTHPDPEDIISLYCKIPTSVKTHYINGIEAYENLESSLRKELKNINIVLGYSYEGYQNIDLPWFIKCDYEPICLSYDSNILPNFSEEDAKNMMSYSYIKRKEYSINIQKIIDIGKKYENVNGKWKAVFRPLIIKNRIGKSGLLFPPGAIIGFTGIEKSEWNNLYRKLWEHMKKFQFIHDWKVGDLLLWENLIGLHKRDPLVENEKRELWRFAIYV